MRFDPDDVSAIGTPLFGARWNFRIVAIRRAVVQAGEEATGTTSDLRFRDAANT